LNDKESKNTDDASPRPGPVPEPSEDATSGLRMIVTMAAIGLISGVLIVFTFQLTLPIITANKARALEAAIFEVVPNAKQKVTFKLAGGTLQPISGDEPAATKYYACYDDERHLVGVAVEAQGQGFQDVLSVLYGYSPACNCIVGLKVLESKETPGLGDKIQSDPGFKANFDALAVHVGADTTTIENPIELVKHGKKTEPWQIEAITGATISSRAIATILRQSTAIAIPVIMKNLSVLDKGDQP
jgi:electron transport complex protein RnfG